MALTKNTVLVWISDVSRAGRRTVTWIGYPQARKKDLETRLKTLASRKVRGQRLESLSYDLLDEQTLPYVREYLSGLFRISELGCVQCSIFEKGTLAEQAGLAYLADSLRTMYPDCDFEIVFDSRYLKKSVLSRWMKKHQIHGTACESLLQENRMLQSATLLSMIDCCGRREQPDLQALCLRQFGMAASWKHLEGADVYLEKIRPQEKEAAANLFDQVPALIAGGRLDSWMKRDIPAGFFEKAARLCEMGLPEQTLLEMTPRRIEESFDALCEQLSEIRKPLDEDLLESWLTQAAALMHALEKRIGWAGGPVEWEPRIRRLLDAWLEKPECFESDERPALCILAEDGSGFRRVISFEQHACWQDPAEGVLLEIAEEQLIQILASLHPSGIYAQTDVLASLRSRSVRQNIYLPLYGISDRQAAGAAACLKADQPARQLVSAKSEAENARGWFTEMIHDYLDDAEIEFLAEHPFSLKQTGQLARSFARGLSLETAQSALSDSSNLSAAVLQLCAPYLFCSRQQRFLAGLQEDWQIDLIVSDRRSLSQMSAVLQLCEKGLDPGWIAVNMKGKSTVRQIQSLALRYPFGKIPSDWNKPVRMPDALSDWLCAQVQGAHPGLEPAQAKRTLNALCRSLPSHLLKAQPDWRPFELESH